MQPRSYLVSTSYVILGGAPDLCEQELHIFCMLVSPISRGGAGAGGDLGESRFMKYQTTVKGQMSLQTVGH